ncbi:MAG TPA: class I SAM-dependent RNA methyltransferase [Alphaproteobacteria bacterium]
MSRRPKKPTHPAEPVRLAITALGAQGEGIALHDNVRMFVPYTVPGDHVRVLPTAADRAQVLHVLAPGPHRQTPPCPHFGPGQCGGCALQHLDDSFYAEWKRELAATTLARAGLSGFELRALARTPPQARRRAEFVAAITRSGVQLGFHVRGSHEIVAIGPCPVLAPELEALLPALRAFLAGAFPAPLALDILATMVTGAIELVFTGQPAPDRVVREALARFAHEAGLARIAWRTARTQTPEIIVQRQVLRATFGQVPVDLPPGAFLQASEAGERAIVGGVRDAVGPAKRVADLYAGAGAITLALAEGRRRLHAVDSGREMIAALDAAARRRGRGADVTTEVRDLARRPLIGDELDRFDAVVFDPPREGAAAQAAALARSKVPIVVGVSCNPATFARDALTLARGGYRLTAVTPIDQFLWSPHLELVGAFTR